MNKFKPQKGQIDFTHARWAPVINCVIKYKDKFLLVQRSRKVNYPELWEGVSGFLDDQKSLQEKVQEEIREELGIPKNKIISVKLGTIFHKSDNKLKKTYIIHPMLVEISTNKITLNWEAQNYKWIDITEARNFKLLPGFEKVIESLVKI